MAVVGLLCLLAASFQLLLWREATGGRTASFGPFGALRVDALSVTLGVVWSLSASLVVFGLKPVERGVLEATSLFVMLAGLLCMAYASGLLPFYLGWEIAGVGVWLLARKVGGVRHRLDLSALMLHVAGWPLLGMLLLGGVRAFVPPEGGVAEAWSPIVALLFGLVVLVRAGCWPLHSWQGLALQSPGSVTALALYATLGPALLAKALVAAPWDAWGTWLLTLVGTAGLLASLVPSLRSKRTLPVPALASVFTTVGVMGFGMASGSSLAAGGACLFLLLAPLWVSLTGRTGGISLGPLGYAALLPVALPGLWLISQGALNLGYGIVSTLTLPLFALAALVATGRPARGAWWRWVPAVLLLAGLAVYPQIVVESVLRSLVDALPGGVPALSLLSSDPGAGLLVRSTGETLAASLPTTGIGVAILLAYGTIYWLKEAARLFANVDPSDTALRTE
ncbi:MAG: hypothetical protein M3014_12895 [Chloroflexota bacterium]|nr:hypothetical protein [Chloroflexota bacterium]